MILSFLTTGKQVLIMFMVMAVGYFMGRLKLLTERGTREMSTLLLYVVTPAMLVVAFQRELVPADLKQFGVAVAVVFASLFVMILLAKLFVRDKNFERQSILQYAAIFSNAGYMGYPLMLALLGPIGVFYGSSYVVAFNVVSWTYGVYLLTGERRMLSIKPILLNPGVLGVAAAMTLYLLRITLPDLLMTPINYLSQLNTSVPMLILGYQFSQADLRGALSGANAWLTLVLRLIVSPLTAIAACLLLHLDGAVAVALVIATSGPPATALSMLAAKFEKDTSLASSTVSVYTAISVLTMSLMVGLARFLFAA